ncbi:MAG TPA: bifunctional 2-polyprenyl-6-hydroxyphenol methylase/3-demethylubiquinol 3-O-methyltransferase UbiG [Gammaproteobacteria bacterium]|nr:bifunctional 2-polyprenyl-6-hydroxyphenol methylase/3-demethylubiquinol 3-O-methyltransferase UbiG [Gammaproteobacteria bacterium]
MTQNVDQDELAKFSRLARDWWDPAGPLKTLHAINPLRLGYIQTHTALAHKKILDIGCGGGLLAESLALQGAEVTGIDLNAEALKAAKLHRLETLEQSPDLKLHYQLISAEERAAQDPACFDLITCMELLEHVPDPGSIIQACAQLLKPGGKVFFSTLNRTLKAYLFAIIGAEYILKLLPQNTHDYAKFIKPSELAEQAKQAGLSVKDLKGIHYAVSTREFSLTEDVSVNYLLYAVK